MADALPSAAQNELASVIVEAWKTFGSRCRLGWPLEVCRCNVCVQPETEALLLNTPIREIPAKLLQAYTESAHASSSYADEQFRALLPRYFELMAAGDWPADSVEVALRRLVDAGWRQSWRRDEVALIDRFFSGLFAHWLTVHEGVIPPELEEAFAYLSEQNVVLARDAARGVMTAFAGDVHGTSPMPVDLDEPERLALPAA